MRPYVVVHVEADRHRIEHRVVDYNHLAVVAVLDEVAHPAREYLERFHIA